MWMWYFVSDSYKKSALSRTDHCSWYLSTSVRHSIQLGRPGNGSYWGSMDAQRSSQLWSRLYIPEWWRMLVLEGKYRNRLVLQMGSSKVVYWPPRFSPSSYQQCSTRLSETWKMASTYSPDRALTYSMSHTSEWRPKLLGYWWESCYSQMTVHWLPNLLKVDIKKTEVMYQSNYIRTREEDIMVDGNKLNSVLEFTYLGSTISSNGCIDDEIQRRMAKAGASFGRLRQRPWNNHHVSMRVKGKIYRVHPPTWSRGLDSVQMTGEKAACLHDATSAFDHEDT